MADIMYVSYTYLTDFVKLAMVLVGIFNMPIIRNKRVYLILAASQLSFLIIGGVFYYYYPDVVIGCNSLVVMIMICFLVEDKFYKKLARSFLSYAVIIFLDASLVAVMSMLNSYSDTRLEHYITNFVNVIFIGFVVLIKRRKYTSFKLNFTKRIYAMLFAGTGTGILIITSLLIESNDNISNAARRFVLFVSIILVAFYCYICLKFSYITESRDNYKELSRISETIIESQQQYYTLVNEKQQEIRSLRHEMKNHIACINSLYQLNRIQEMEAYMGELIQLSTKTGELFDTGNDIVNAILNDVQSKYKKENISLRVEGGFPKDIIITPMDLSVIFANLISNAVEAIQRMKSREGICYIDIRITSYKSDLYIDVKNPCENNLIIENGTMVTSKKDRTRHGFGVNNVIHKVEKYHGSYCFKQENNEFIVEIFIENMRKD